MQRLLQEHYRHYIARLRTALLACPNLDSYDDRAAVLDELPDEIRNNLNVRLTTSIAIVHNLVKTCAGYADGDRALFAAINVYEVDSLPFQQAWQEWRKIKQAMDEQDQLIAWIRMSGTSLAELKRLFDTVVPQDYAANPHSIETLTHALWEVPAGHTLLLTFMRDLTAMLELPDPVRNAISAWIAAAERNDILRLATIEDQEAESVETRLIITIEFGKQDLTKRQISFRRSDGSLEDIVELEGNQLEHVISKEIDHWTLMYETVTPLCQYRVRHSKPRI